MVAKMFHLELTDTEAVTSMSNKCNRVLWTLS